MAKKLETLLGVSLVALMLSSITSCANARPVTIEGVVRYEDNDESVSNAEVRFTQLHGLWFAKPKALGKAVTDDSGRYRIDIQDAKGTIDVRIALRRCHYAGGVAQIDAAAIGGDGVASLDLSLKRDRCQ